MKIPKKLQEGDKVVICPFSDPIPENYSLRLNNCINALENHGLKVITSQYLISNDSLSSEEIASELNSYLCDDDISAVIPPWGGDLAIKVLPLLDWQSISKSKPKWIFGFSDVSTLMNAITEQLDWYTIHSANLMQLANNSHCNYVRSLFKLIFSAEKGYGYTQISSKSHESDYPDYVKNPSAAYNLDTITELIKLNCETNAKYEGYLVGGCIDTLQLTYQTQFINFKKEQFNKGKIIYLENAELNFAQYQRALVSLKLKGLFDNCVCILIGRNKFAYSHKQLNFDVNLLNNTIADLKVPIIANVDIGHVSPNFTLVNGALAQIHIEETQLKLTQNLI